VVVRADEKWVPMNVPMNDQKFKPVFLASRAKNLGSVGAFR
jgi:hypothetical protein